MGKDEHSITVELIPDPEVGGFTARIPDIPAYGEGKTEDEAIADLKEAVQAYVESFGVEDAESRLTQPASLRQLSWNLAEFAK
jgi:predicted RNase H-like HicB family nuclease